MADKFGFRVEGVRDLTRALGQVEPELRKELGQKNKAIGQSIIDRSFPKPINVGAGAGAKPRASATTNILRIMAGGSWRSGSVEKRNRQPWGKRPKSRGGVKRPFIRRSAEAHMPEIKRDYLDALLDVARKAGIEANLRPGA